MGCQVMGCIGVFAFILYIGTGYRTCTCTGYRYRVQVLVLVKVMGGSANHATCTLVFSKAINTTQGSVTSMSSLFVLAIAILLSLTSARPLVREIRTDREFQRLLKVSTVIFCVFHVLSSFSFRPTLFFVSLRLTSPSDYGKLTILLPTFSTLSLSLSLFLSFSLPLPHSANDSTTKLKQVFPSL